MVAGETKTDLDALVAASYDSHTGRPGFCTKQDTGPLMDYLDKLRDVVAGGGQPPVYAQVRRLISQHFGVRVGYEAIKAHVEGSCPCRK